MNENSQDLLVDVDRLRNEVRAKYREVAADPAGAHHFHTGRPLAARLGYPAAVVDALPDAAVESFAGVGNPFSLRTISRGEHVVDVGSGAGLDSFVAASYVGAEGRVVGIDMTDEMLAKARSNAVAVGTSGVEFRRGYLRTSASCRWRSARRWTPSGVPPESSKPGRLTCRVTPFLRADQPDRPPATRRTAQESE